MRSVNRLLKFFWIFTLLIFTTGLFYGYYLLPDVVCIKFDANGNPMDYMPRKYIFYFFSGICGVLNVVFIMVEKALLLIPHRLKPVPNKKFWLSTAETKEGLNYAISDWVYSLASFVNISLFASFYALAKVNTNLQTNIMQYYWVFQTITILLVLCLLYLPFRLLISKIFIK